MAGHFPESHVSEVDVSIGPTQTKFVQEWRLQSVPLNLEYHVSELRMALADLQHRVALLERPWWIKLRDWLKGLFQ